MAAVNNNTSTVIVGRTSPVSAGQQTSAKSIPVVIASDQSAIPVEEQNKQQSEVALSLLGIPRSEVALGIFADVNTYDVNPTEWTTYPEQFTSLNRYQSDGSTERPAYSGTGGEQDWGLTHIAEEAGAMIEAPADEYSILTSKRFFRYQPGRVSAATFGVKLNRSPYTINPDSGSASVAVRNGSVKKYGIFDKFDGYYFESRNDGYGDNFTCVRRTQSIIRDNPLPFSTNASYQQQDYEVVGVPKIETDAQVYLNAYEIIKANKRYLQEVAVQSLDSSDREKCLRDSGLIIEGILHDIKNGGNATTVYNTLKFFNTTDPNVAITLYLDNPTIEVARYNAIKTAVTAILGGSAPSPSSYTSNSITFNATAGGSSGLPSAESGAVGKVQSLLDIVITALTGTGNYGSIPTPSGSAAGEMCVYRDGLTMIHAAAHDPSLLKEKCYFDVVSTVSSYSTKDSGTKFFLKIKIPSGKDALQVGQAFSVNKTGSDNVTDSANVSLVDGQVWHVYESGEVTVDANGNIFQLIRLSKHPANEEIYGTPGGNSKLSNPWGATQQDLAYPAPEIFEIGAAAALSSFGTLQTPVPFLLPEDGRKYRGSNYTDGSLNDDPNNFSDGAFPYVYPAGGSSDPASSVGYIDTSNATIANIKAQTNYVNKRLYKNWIWFNVDPRYYKVYEYRVPRSRMSGEKLNGVTTDVVYSDNVLNFKAGDPVLEPTTGDQIQFESVWNLDPTKVTMYKIEFSWYGAVGATFLAYVPVSNGEARWVRVHHLRASNQLKVASLGNATLPITYMVYGGGSGNKYGYVNADRVSNTGSGYGSYSEQLVKYGASYYIDGGDRGTVRLFSFASETLKSIGGSKYLFVANDNNNLFTNASANQDQTPGSAYVNAPEMTIAAYNGAPTASDYYMNARVVTNDTRDQDVRVVWSDTNKLYLSRPLVATSGNVSIVVERPQPLVGVKCRTEINGVRNRVQIYPTRLATGLTGSSESLVVQLIKSPKFQTLDVPGNGSIHVNGAINVGKRGKRIALPIGNNADQITETGTFLSAGQKTFGYFRYTIVNDQSGNAYTMLGVLEKDSTGYYFSANDVTLDEINIRGTFLRAGHYSGPGDNSDNPDLSSAMSSGAYPSSSLSRLSAVNIDREQRSPIPGTGVTVTTLFAPNSGAEFDLQSYFDYNKDYLSFPLTDLVDSLYVCASSKSFYRGNAGTGSYTTKGEMLASLTWEEQ